MAAMTARATCSAHLALAAAVCDLDALFMTGGVAEGVACESASEGRSSARQAADSKIGTLHGFGLNNSD